jgi:dihydroorotate dehydrogenase electron transfer subunit
MIANGQIAEGFYELSLAWEPGVAPIPAPGQFLTVRIGSGAVPLLRRPFAFAGFDAASSVVTIIYQKRGAGTELLSAKRAGEPIDVIGPLGTPFAVRDTRIDTDNNVVYNKYAACINPQKHIIAAGGIGVGPMLFLASSLKARGIPARFVFGCRNQSFIPSVKTFADANPQICTDDGGAGFRGTVADYVNANMSLDINTTVYACGPLPMLRSVNEIARTAGAKCLVSLEAVMACGVGACMGCAVPVAGGGYSRVCKEGPVFDGKDILWERM